MTKVGYAWDCPNCGEHITSATKPPVFHVLPLDMDAAALSQRITDAVNAGERPVDDMGLASILHHFAHQVADDRDDGLWVER